MKKPADRYKPILMSLYILSAETQAHADRLIAILDRCIVSEQVIDQSGQDVLLKVCCIEGVYDDQMIKAVNDQRKRLLYWKLVLDW